MAEEPNMASRHSEQDLQLEDALTNTAPATTLRSPDLSEGLVGGEDGDLATELPRWATALPLPPRPAKAAAVKRLADTLVERGLPSLIAEATARAVVDPSAVRREMTVPIDVRVMGGGVLEVLRADVWAATAIPFPANPRESALKRLPIQDVDSVALPQPDVMGSAPAALEVRARSRDQVAQSLNTSSALLLGINPYIEEIRTDGVLVPVMLVPIVFKHGDHTADVAALAAVDGSSRLASAHSLLAVQPSEVAYLYGQDVRRLYGLIGEVTTAVERVHAGIATDSPPPSRALIVPAYIIVGCRGVDLRRAIQGYLGMAHVSHPTPWGEAGEVEAKADAALLEMRDAGLSRRYVAWFSGELRPQEMQDLGHSRLLDRRLLEIVATVHDYRRAASVGIRRVDRKVQRVWDNKLGEVCADLALRPVRNSLGRRGRDADIARQSLQEILEKAFKKGWTVTQRDPEELRDVAITELAKGLQPGPAGMELLLLASYWLTSTNLLRPLYYAQRLADGEADRRGVHQIAYGMLDSVRGIHQLHRAVRDGRDGAPARTVDAEGAVVVDHQSRRPLALSNDTLRMHIVPRPDGAEAAQDEPPPPGETPETQLLRAQADIGRNVRTLRAVVETLSAIKVGATAAVELYGWPVEAVEEISNDLNLVQRRLHHWQAVAEGIRDRQAAEASESKE